MEEEQQTTETDEKDDDKQKMVDPISMDEVSESEEHMSDLKEAEDKKKDSKEGGKVDKEENETHPQDYQALAYQRWVMLNKDKKKKGTEETK